MDIEKLRATPVLEKPPERVVSLVPSMTESLFTLGFGDSLVGITKYCVHPADQVKKLPKVGGTKKAKVDEILALQPDLVIANQEENDQETIESLVEAGVSVWLSFPRTVEDAIDDLRRVLAIYEDDRAARSVAVLQQAADWARGASLEMEKPRYFCPIWEGTFKEDVYWMTFNKETYIHDLLDILGGENVFAERVRRYPLEADLGQGKEEEPGERDTRYPCVTVDEVLAAEPELIILPSEPFDFESKEAQNVKDLLVWTPAGKNNKVLYVDGSLITWPGVRMGKALQDLPEMFLDLN